MEEESIKVSKNKNKNTHTSREGSLETKVSTSNPIESQTPPIEQPAPTPTKLIGPFLQEAREAAGKSLEEISHKTKINLTLLKQLETSKVDNLPNKTYVRGFIKGYCREVGIPLDKALEVFEQSYSYLNPQEEGELDKDVFPEEPNAAEVLDGAVSKLRNLPPQFYRISLFAIGVIGVLTLILTQITSQEEKSVREELSTEKLISDTELAQNRVDQSPKKKEVQNNESAAEEPVVAMTEEAPLKEEAPKQELVKEEAPIEKKQTLNDKITAELEEASIDPSELPDVKLAKDYQFYKIKMPLYDLTTSANNDDLLPDNIKQSVVPGVQNLFINATNGDSWLTYKRDDGPIKSFVLKNGRTLLIRGNEIRIFFGNLNSVTIFLNNQKVKTRSSNGVKSLVFPQSSAEKYVTPLFIRDRRGNSFTSSDYLNNTL